MNSAEQMWDRFIQHLNEVDPLGKKGEVIPHKTFLGSVERYKEIFLEANKTVDQNT